MKPKLLLAAILFIFAGPLLFAQAPTITLISPGQGHIGTLITITGTNLSSSTAFTVGGAAGIVVSKSATQLVGFVMPGTVTGLVSVTTPSGTVNSINKFTVIPTATAQMVSDGGNGFQNYGIGLGLSANGNTGIMGFDDIGTTIGNYISGAAVVARNGPFIYGTETNDWLPQGQYLPFETYALVGTGGFNPYSLINSVAISADGNTAVIGSAPNVTGASEVQTGSVWFFTRSGSTWTQQGPIMTGTGGVGASLQGTSVAMSADGNTVVVGGSGDNNSIGAVWVFTRSNGTWTQQGGKLVGTGGVGKSGQGQTVALSADGNTLLIGGPYDQPDVNNQYDYLGAIWVFTRSDGVWTQQGSKLVGSGYQATPQGYVTVGEGISIALSADGNTALVGGPDDNNGIGATWVFTRSGGTWSQQGSKLVGSGVVYNYASQGSGVALSADGNTALIGGPNDNSNAGAVWEFTRSGAVWTQLGAKISGYGKYYFGNSIALSADATTAFVTRPGITTSVGGGQVDVYLALLPADTTLAATNITTTGATLNGTVDGNGAASTTVTMQYGTSPTLAGATTATLTTGASPVTAAAGSTAFTSVLTDLTPGTTYYFSITGTNIYGTAPGAILSFTTTAPALQPQTITFPPLASVTYGAADVTPGATSTNTSIPITYTSSNTGVATITGNGAIHVVGAGSTQITASQAGNATYSPAMPVIQTFTVTPAALTIAASSPTAVYGTGIPAITIVYNGFVNGDTQASLTTQPVVGSTAVGISGVGNYQTTASGAVDPNYTITYVPGNLSITPAPLTITADNQSTEYEVGIPPLTVSYSGFVYSDSQSSLTTQPMVTTTATVSSVAGTYPITASGAADPNYTITYVPGTLTIDAVAPTAVTQAATAISSSGATLNGTVSDGGASTTVQFLFGTDPHLTGATTVAVTTGASPIAAGTGTVAFTAVMTGLNPGTTYYYEITGANSAGPLGGGILSFTTATIPVAVITFTSPTTAVYGAGDLTPNATSNSDGAPITYTSSNPGVASITDNGEIHVAGAGATQLTASQAAGGGFAAATPVILTLTVTPAPLSVTASSPTAVYGAGIPAITVSYTGFVNGDTQSSLTTAATGSTTATGRSGVGNYPTTAGGAVDPNYAITYVPGNLSITPAPLTVTANNQTITTGSAIPALTVSYSGFVNDDDAGNLTTAPTVATSATPASGPGQYPITVSGAADPNYTITYVPGTLTITAPLVFNTIGSKTYGNPDFNPGATGTDVTYSSGTTSVATITDGGLIHITGAGTSVITATGGGTTIQQTLTVLPAPLIITANDQTRVYNTDNPALTVSYSGFVYSDNAASLTTAVTVATTADISSDAGTYPITASGASDPNYTITYVGGTLTVTKASQTISFAAIPDQVINGHYDLANVSASSGLPVSFALSDPSIAMVSGSTLISLQVGSETLTASQAGNGNYAPAVNAAQSFKIIDDSGNDVIVNQVVSPNGDGIDDVLNIKNIENYPDNKLTLVNRDGVMIYQATGYNNTSRAFDGHSSVTGTLQQQGTLLYILEFTVNGQYHRKTGFTVLRY